MHFVDSVGFSKLDVFLGNESQNTQNEQTAENLLLEDKNTTFSQIGKSRGTEIISKNNNVIPIVRKNEENKSINSKPTLMKRLEAGKQKAAQISQKNNSIKEIEGARE